MVPLGACAVAVVVKPTLGREVGNYIVMGYILMADTVMAYIVVAYTVMTYIVMAYIVMACIVMAYIVMACIVMACIVMAYIVMACIVWTRLSSLLGEGGGEEGSSVGTK